METFRGTNLTCLVSVGYAMFMVCRELSLKPETRKQVETVMQQKLGSQFVYIYAVTINFSCFVGDVEVRTMLTGWQV